MTSYFIGGLAGLLLGVGTIFFPLWPLSLLSFAFLAYILYNEEKLIQKVVSVSLMGAVSYGCSFYGIYFETLPLDWLGLSDMVAFGILFSIWALTVAVFICTFTLLLVLGYRLLHNKWFDAVIIASCYVLADTLGTFIYSLVFYGSGSLVGTHFAMGSPAYQLADSQILLQFASLGGLYALLFIQGLLGYLLYVTVQIFKTISARIIVGIIYISVVLLVCYIPVSNNSALYANSDTISIAAFGAYQFDKSIDFNADLYKRIISLPKNIDIILLPEDTRLIQNLDQQQSDELTQIFSETSHIVDSGSVRYESSLIPEIQFYSTKEQESQISSKSFLMIFGEYMPYLYSRIGILIGQDEVIQNMKENNSYKTASSKLFVFKGNKLSVKLCSDAMSPTLYAKDTDKGAGILFNLAAHGWFHYSELMYDLSKRVGKVRAVENNRWYIRASYTTPAFAINQRGNVVAESEWFDYTTISVEAPLIEDKTMYTKLRLWVLAMPIGILLCCLMYLCCGRLFVRKSYQGDQ